MNKLLSLILTIGVAFPATLFSQEVVYVEKGQVAPFSGYLFTPKKEAELRLLKIEYDLLVTEVDIKTKLIEKYKLNLEYSNQLLDKEQQKTELWRKASEEATDKYMKNEQYQDLRDWLLFFLGVAVTMGAAYALGQINGGK